MFLIIVNIFRVWYDYVIFSVMTAPYTYVLLMLWLAITLFFLWVLLRKKDYFALTSWHHELALAVSKGCILGLFLATLCIAFYNAVLCWIAESNFFTNYRVLSMQISTHLTSQTLISELMRRRILTMLFLLFSTPSVWYFVESCNCWFSDQRVWNRIFWATIGSALGYYLLGMLLGFV